MLTQSKLGIQVNLVGWEEGEKLCVCVREREIEKERERVGKERDRIPFTRGPRHRVGRRQHECSVSVGSSSLVRLKKNVEML